MPARIEEDDQVRYQPLDEGNFNEGKLYTLKQNWSLRLTLNNRLIHRKIRVFANMPKTNTSPFERTTYYEYEWIVPTNSCVNDEFCKYVDVKCHQPGSFRYYFTAEDGHEPLGGSNFLVDPNLYLPNGRLVNPDSLQMQTYLTKSLGRLTEWKSRLQVAYQSGYNIIHFTPVQALSQVSGSSYSIRDHLRLMDVNHSLDDLKTLLDSMYQEWGVFSLCDLVYNHISNDSPFLVRYPHATYNMVNSPHLRPALVFDRVLYHVTRSIEAGRYVDRSVFPDRIEHYYMDAIRHIIRDEELPKHKLDQFYTIDAGRILKEIKQLGLSKLEQIEANLEEFRVRVKCTNECRESLWSKLVILQDAQYRRLASTVDFGLVSQILDAELQELDPNSDIKNSDYNSSLLVRVYERFKNTLQRLNEQVRCKAEENLTYGVNNVMSHFYYHFLDSNGPKWMKICRKSPVVSLYFYFPFPDADVAADETLAYDQESGLKIQAHNGWVMGDDPLKNFAAPESNVYFKRELIAWDDSVKLRYGKEPSDSPDLWAYMAEYTRETARIFHGVRLDNCHSTPIHVAQYFLDIARKIRPNLLVIAELFTNSEFVDNKFVSELGITSLVREAMNAWNANELGRLIHRFGGDPVGSFYQPTHRPLCSGVAHAILYDVTHDNPSLIQKRSVYDTLPTGALCLMANCSVGSTRGFDELVPHHIHVVNETRPYSQWSSQLSLTNGILDAKRLMNQLHFEMNARGFAQIYVDQFDADTTVVTRHNPTTHESYVLMVRTSFTQPGDYTPQCLSKPLEIPSKIEQIVVEMRLEKIRDAKSFEQSESYLNGLVDYGLVLKENVSVGESSFIGHLDYDNNRSVVHFKYFPPGAVILFKIALNENAQKHVKLVRESIDRLDKCKIYPANDIPSDLGNLNIETILNGLNRDELNILLYRCSQEETSERIDSDVYTLNNYGSLIYCGLQGFMNILERERLRNNLGHPLYENLRNGDWMLNYMSGRLRKYAKLAPKYRINLERLANWLSELFGSLSQIPRYLIPTYFDLIVTHLYTKSLDRCWSLMSTSGSGFNVANGSAMVKQLALNSFSLVGYLCGSTLPETLCDAEDLNSGLPLSLSAGLPHFSATYMRNWGRDTFISLRGLLMLTNRFADAKNLILTYGSCLRHGLIPNLLGEGRFARYNCRDAVWWWLKAIRDYSELAPNGESILDSTVLRLYPTDDAQLPDEETMSKRIGPNVQKLRDLIQEALSVHVKGLKFRERNAGPAIDDRMCYEGFNNEIGVDFNTGFVFGGNKLNAGTWMDKMGSSMKAGNNGVPATPRDGSAVELVGLSRCVLDWLIKLNQTNKYPYDGVILEGGGRFTWAEWAQKIDQNFEKHFWIDEQSTDSPLINQRNIYKDTLNSSLPWSDYQLRPNFLVALTVAPQMFNPEHARKALEQVRLHLVNEPNTIGIKTLDDSDYNYCGYYDNSNDSYDKRVAHGFNYHQGPEWLWPVGFYLRAYLHYNKQDDAAKALVKQHLGKLNQALTATDWKSLPELTNRNGDACSASCPSQAWSVATILEVFYDLAHSA